MQNWISVQDKLPANGDYVLIYAGNYIQKQKYDVVRFETGISLEDREKMKNGEMPSEPISGVILAGDFDKPIYSLTPRWNSYTSSDEQGNNKKPYSWSSPPMRYCGQDVTHWMPLPEIPKKQTDE